MIIREYKSGDLPALAALWEDVFGDSKEYISAFLSLLPGLGSCFIAELDGELISAAYILTGAEIIRPGGNTPAAYLYAAATKPGFRGRGAAGSVCRMAAEYARAAGCGVITTLPAGESLYGWYANLLGTGRCLCTGTLTFPAKHSPAVRQIGAGEYLRLREELCRGTEYLRVPPSWAALLEALCSLYGGGLFECGGSICACTLSGDRAAVSELLPLTAADCAQAAAFRLGAGQAVCRIPGGSDKYIAYSGHALPEGLIWNYSFD